MGEDTGSAPRPASRHGESKAFAVRRGDTLAELFRRAGLSPVQLQAVLDLGGPVRQLVALHPGDQVRIHTGADGELLELHYPLDALNTLVISQTEGELHETVSHIEPTHRLSLATGTVHSSLASAMRHTGLDAATVTAVARIFRWRVDFRRDVHPGATFSVLYDEMEREERRIGTGPVLAVALTLGHRSLRAFRYVDGDKRVHYFDERGRSLTPSLLRTPLHYTRVSSPFSLHRFDPVTHVWRPHLGVDLAAPRGTPIKAAGDGVIAFLGQQGGYGNLVEIDHFGPYTTRYAHLRRFASGLHRGDRVSQGAVIGYVGQSGEATGPHLHFEIRVNGKAHDPLRMTLPDSLPIPRGERARFDAQIRPLVAALDHRRPGAVRLASDGGSGKARPEQMVDAATDTGDATGG